MHACVLSVIKLLTSVVSRISSQSLKEFTLTIYIWHPGWTWLHACVLSVIKSELLITSVVSRISGQSLKEFKLAMVYIEHPGCMTYILLLRITSKLVHDGELILTVSSKSKSVSSSTCTATSLTKELSPFSTSSVFWVKVQNLWLIHKEQSRCNI